MLFRLFGSTLLFEKEYNSKNSRSFRSDNIDNGDNAELIKNVMI